MLQLRSISGKVKITFDNFNAYGDMLGTIKMPTDMSFVLQKYVNTHNSFTDHVLYILYNNVLSLVCRQTSYIFLSNNNPMSIITIYLIKNWQL